MCLSLCSFASLSADAVVFWSRTNFQRSHIFTCTFSPPFRALCPLLPAWGAPEGAPRPRSTLGAPKGTWTEEQDETSSCCTPDSSSREQGAHMGAPSSRRLHGSSTVSRGTPSYAATLGAPKGAPKGPPPERVLKKPVRLKRVLLLQGSGLLSVWREQQKHRVQGGPSTKGKRHQQQQLQHHQQQYRRECSLDAAAAAVLTTETAAAPSCYTFSQ